MSIYDHVSLILAIILLVSLGWISSHIIWDLPDVLGQTLAQVAFQQNSRALRRTLTTLLMMQSRVVSLDSVYEYE